MRARGLLVIGLTIGFMTLALPAISAGSAEVSFIVSPSQLEIEVEPGGTAWASVRVYNKQDTALELRTYVRDIEIPQSDLIAQGDLAFSASAWIQFREQVIEVAPGGVTDAILAVQVPDTAAPGGYHTFGYMQTDATPAEAGSSVGVSARVGVTLLLDVVPPGTQLERSVRMSDFDVSVHWDGLFHPVVRTEATVDNVGDTHVLVGGIQTYRGWPGSETLQQKVGPYTLLRGTRHTLTSDWVGPFIGRVTVTSELVYQRGPDDLPAIVIQRTVWIIPWHLIVPLLVGIALLGLLWVRMKRRQRQPRHAAGYHRPAASQRRRQLVASSSGGKKR